MERTSLPEVDKLEAICDAIPNTATLPAAKIGALVAPNMRLGRERFGQGDLRCLAQKL